MARTTKQVFVYDLEADRVVACHEGDRRVFEPHGLVDDGKWVVGAVFGYPNDPNDPRSLYFCPLHDWIEGRHREATRTVDLSPILPLKKAPLAKFHLARYTRPVLDLGQGRFAVLVLVCHRPISRTGKVVTMLVVVSRSDAAVVAVTEHHSRRVHLGQRDGDWITAIEVIEDVRAPGRKLYITAARVPHFPHTTRARQIRFPLDDKQSVELGRVQSVPGNAIAFGQDGASVFAIRPYVAPPLIGDLATGEIRPLHGLSPALNQYAAWFSRDCRLLGVMATQCMLDEDRFLVPIRPFDRILIYDVASGRLVNTIRLDPAYRSGAVRFTDDNRYLVTSLREPERKTTGPFAARTGKFLGYQLWDLSNLDASDSISED